MICHGVAVIAGGNAPDLRANEIPANSDAFAAVVLKGLLRARGMPQFNELDPAEVESARKYIRNEANKGIEVPLISRVP